VRYTVWTMHRGATDRQGLDSRGLSYRLKQYAVKPQTIRVGCTTPKGYRCVDLRDAWSRYLPQQEPATDDVAIFDDVGI